MNMIQGESIAKTYKAGDMEVPALKDVSFAIEAGGFAAFVGPSGSGKSTLLNLVGCLDRPSAGLLTVLGTDVAKLSRNAAAAFRGASTWASSSRTSTWCRCSAPMKTWNTRC
jgi:putative ABC transport system ATP-binding protein